MLSVSCYESVRQKIEHYLSIMLDASLEDDEIINNLNFAYQLSSAAVSEYPRCADAYVVNAVVLAMLDREDDAYDNYNKALEINPHAFRPYARSTIAFSGDAIDVCFRRTFLKE